jgi:MSHA pilin protein MshA
MRAKGFTLIELVVVIVILGLLAATVAPKFIDLSVGARTVSLEGVKISVQGTSYLVHSITLIAGNQSNTKTDTPIPSITLSSGSSTALSYRYLTVPGNFTHPIP